MIDRLKCRRPWEPGLRLLPGVSAAEIASPAGATSISRKLKERGIGIPGTHGANRMM